MYSLAGKLADRVRARLGGSVRDVAAWVRKQIAEHRASLPPQAEQDAAIATQRERERARKRSIRGC